MNAKRRPLATKQDLQWLLSRLIIVAVLAIAGPPLLGPLLAEHVFNPANLADSPSYGPPIELPNLGGHKTGL